MNTKYLLIPKTIKIGFQERYDTYTKKLAYVTYIDNKGKLRKETSWEGWRDCRIPVEEYDNIPTEGFVLNKNVGGCKLGWDYRKSYIRVYDPRGFEFEITLENLLFILENCICTPGKGLEGEFVYSWNGTELVLLPTKSPDYKEAKKYNETLKKLGTFSYKDLKVGYTYKTKKDEQLVFLGRYEWYDEKCEWRSNKKEFKKSIRYLFANVNYSNNGKLCFYYKAMAQVTVSNHIIGLVSEDIPDGFDKMIEKIQHSEHISPIDYENIELLDMTFKQFEEMIQDGKTIFFHNNGKLMFTSKFENINGCSFYKEELTDESIKCYYEEYSKDKNLNAWIDKTKLDRMIFKNFQAFYDEMKPKIGVLHLKNGYVYKNFFINKYENVYIN